MGAPACVLASVFGSEDQKSGSYIMPSFIQLIKPTKLHRVKLQQNLTSSFQVISNFLYNSQGQRSRSYVTNIQSLLEFTTIHIPSK